VSGPGLPVVVPTLPSGDPYDPPDDPLIVLHEDDHLLVVDKPSGLLTVPGRALDLHDCLEHRLRRVFPESLLLHRLDLPTSGVLLFARSPAARRHVARQFNKRRIGKVYEALVWGRPAADAGRIDAPLCCDWPRRPLQHVSSAHGRPSTTDWEVVREEGPLTRLRLRPLTGRTHQLRVHLQHLGHPIAGDRFYATGPAREATPRLALHAHAITLRHPEDGRTVTYRSPVPF
jgi:tRNA pseudouridine32 synthase/23S rRNA pseudouridine746 synthase